MKAFMVSEDIKRLIKSTARFISKDEDRSPIFRFIRLDFSKDSCSVKAVAVDGYRLSVENAKCVSVDEDFTAYIKPVLPGGSKADYAIIEVVNETCLVDFGGQITGWKQPSGNPVDVTHLIKGIDSKPITAKFAINESFLIDALKSVHKEHKTLNEPIIIEFRDQLSPIVIRNKNGVKVVHVARIPD